MKTSARCHREETDGGQNRTRSDSQHQPGGCFEGPRETLPAAGGQATRIVFRLARSRTRVGPADELRRPLPPCAGLGRSKQRASEGAHAGKASRWAPAHGAHHQISSRVADTPGTRLLGGGSGLLHHGVHELVDDRPR